MTGRLREALGAIVMVVAAMIVIAISRPYLPALKDALYRWWDSTKGIVTTYPVICMDPELKPRNSCEGFPLVALPREQFNANANSHVVATRFIDGETGWFITRFDDCTVWDGMNWTCLEPGDTGNVKRLRRWMIDGRFYESNPPLNVVRVSWWTWWRAKLRGR